LSKVTLIWVSRPGKPFSIISVPKGLIFAAAGVVCLALLASVTMFVFYEQRIAIAQENLRLYEAITEKEKLNQDQAGIIAEKGELLNALEQQLSEVKTFESKIRQFLGLDGKVTNPKHPNQGGIVTESLDSFPPAKIPSLGEHAGSAGVDIQPRTRSLRNNLIELMGYIRNRQIETDMLPTMLPVGSRDVWLASGFGWRSNPITGRGSEFHAGLDIAGALMTPVKAPADGDVEETGENKLLGNFIKIRHSKKLTTVYGHLHSIKVSEGQMVKREDVIGYMGNTGRTTGIHLHYSVLKDGAYVDPADYILDCDVSSLTLDHTKNEAFKILY
jgi:murein DD-endopeptidase MepM/ murein hydrolase activator NlpD